MVKIANNLDPTAPSIAVIMSTYNGERYLRDQIDSVLIQDIPNLRLYVRDDGSTDSTPSLLAQYEQAGLASVTYGKNKGTAESFFICLRDAEPADYYAFCDQDDLWLTDKLSRAVSMLEQASTQKDNKPLLYCSELNYCNESLIYERSSYLNRRGVSLTTQLYETICSGNTMVFNEALCKEILLHGWHGAFLHDWWTSLIACAFGSIIWDKESRIMYRRGIDNVSPSGMRFLSLQLYRIRKILLGGEAERIQRQVASFGAIGKTELTDAERTLLWHMINSSNLSRALTPTRLRQRIQDEILLRMSMLAGLV